MARTGSFAGAALTRRRMARPAPAVHAARTAGQIIVGAHFQTDHAIDLVALRRQHQNRNMVVGAPAAGRSKAHPRRQHRSSTSRSGRIRCSTASIALPLSAHSTSNPSRCRKSASSRLISGSSSTIRSEVRAQSWPHSEQGRAPCKAGGAVVTHCYIPSTKRYQPFLRSNIRLTRRRQSPCMATATAAFIHQGDRDHEETHRHVHACRRSLDRCHRRRQRLDPLRDLDRTARDVERAGLGLLRERLLLALRDPHRPGRQHLHPQGTVSRY